MILLKNVTKKFGSFEALRNISFEIKKGEIVGFLGQNGAGKTTLMRILTSFLPATSGDVIIDGQDMNAQYLSIRRKIGYLPETPPLYMNMTVKDYLKFAARLKDVPAKLEEFQVDRMLSDCDLQNVQNKIIANLSRGYKQRVGIAQAMIHNPPILILDEPTNGLDPIQILSVRKLIKNLEQERIVILSTHILSEIEQIAKRVLIIKAGQIIVDSSIDELCKRKDLIDPDFSGSRLEQVFLKLVAEEPYV